MGKYQALSELRQQGLLANLHRNRHVILVPIEICILLIDRLPLKHQQQGYIVYEWKGRMCR